ERNPPVTRAAQSTKIVWDSPIDRWARIFGERDAPYVAHWLRFYVRNGRFRTLYLLSVVIGAFLTMSGGAGRLSRNNYYAAALGALPVMTFMGNSRMAVNQFGYLGGGYRRLFLLPADSEATLRTGSLASMLLGLATIPVGLVAWAIFGPIAAGAPGI